MVHSVNRVAKCLSSEICKRLCNFFLPSGRAVPEPMPRLTDFSALTFDCYGTLIDWETGIWDALQPLILHVAQSLHHDHAPANRFGIANAWIDRQRLSEGGSWGATEPMETVPSADFVYFSIGEMAEAVGGKKCEV